MFFTSIQKLLTGAEAVTIIVVPADEGRIGITVAPKMSSGANAVLKQPINLIATAEELDAQFAELMDSYAGTRKTLSEQLAAAEAEMKKSAAAAKSAKTTPAAKPVTVGKPQAVSIDDLTPDDDGEGGDEAGDEGGDGDIAPTAAPAQPAASQAPQGGLDLASLL